MSADHTRRSEGGDGGDKEGRDTREGKLIVDQSESVSLDHASWDAEKGGIPERAI